MVKKRSPTKILEEDKEPAFEAGLVKTPGGKWTDYQKEKSTASSYLSPEFKEKHIKNKPYSIIHTHPRLERETLVTDVSALVEPEYREFMSLTKEEIEQMRADVSPSFPSDQDLLDILMYKNKRSSIIGQRDPITGKVAGYFIIRKTKDTPLLTPIPEGNVTDKKMEEWYAKPEIKEAYETLESQGYYISPSDNSRLSSQQLSQNEDALNTFAKKYSLQIKKVPNKGYSYEKGLGFLKKVEGNNNLEQKVSSVIAITGLFSSMFFLGAEVTGNVVGSLSKISGNIIGLVLFIVGILAAVFYFRRR